MSTIAPDSDMDLCTTQMLAMGLSGPTGCSQIVGSSAPSVSFAPSASQPFVSALAGRTHALQLACGQCGQCGQCYAASSETSHGVDRMETWHWMHSVDPAVYDEEYDRYLRQRLDSEAREANYHAALANGLHGGQGAACQAAMVTDDIDMDLCAIGPSA